MTTDQMSNQLKDSSADSATGSGAVEGVSMCGVEPEAANSREWTLGWTLGYKAGYNDGRQQNLDTITRLHTAIRAIYRIAIEG